MYVPQLLIEAGMVSLVTAVALAGTVHFTGRVDTLRRALVVGAVLGALIHLLFELAGANATYCRIGAACSLS